MGGLTHWKAVALICGTTLAAAALGFTMTYGLRSMMLARSQFFFVSSKEETKAWTGKEFEASWRLGVDGYVNCHLQTKLFDREVTKEEFNEYDVGDWYITGQRRPQVS